jgi:hypothetical protein
MSSSKALQRRAAPARRPHKIRVAVSPRSAGVHLRQRPAAAVLRVDAALHSPDFYSNTVCDVIGEFVESTAPAALM